MAKDLSEKKAETVVDEENLSSDGRSLHRVDEFKILQTETPKDAMKNGQVPENEIMRLWESKLESNLAEKLGMAFELFDMGLSEEAIDRILHLNQKRRIKGE